MSYSQSLMDQAIKTETRMAAAKLSLVKMTVFVDAEGTPADMADWTDKIAAYDAANQAIRDFSVAHGVTPAGGSS